MRLWLRYIINGPAAPPTPTIQPHHIQHTPVAANDACVHIFITASFGTPPSILLKGHAAVRAESDDGAVFATTDSDGAALAPHAAGGAATAREHEPAAVSAAAKEADVGSASESPQGARARLMSVPEHEVREACARGVSVAWLVRWTNENNLWDMPTWQVVESVIKPATKGGSQYDRGLARATERVTSLFCCAKLHQSRLPVDWMWLRMCDQVALVALPWPCMFRCCSSCAIHPTDWHTHTSTSCSP